MHLKKVFIRMNKFNNKKAENYATRDLFIRSVICSQLSYILLQPRFTACYHSKVLQNTLVTENCRCLDNRRHLHRCRWWLIVHWKTHRRLNCHRQQWLRISQ